MSAQSAFTAIGLVFLAVGLVILFFLLRQLRRAWQSRQWPRVRGTIQHSGTQRKVFYQSPSHPADRVESTTLDFRYDYTVHRQAYTGTRVTLSDSVIKTGRQLQRRVEQFPPGKTVDVYYNPENPAESVLIPGASLYHFTPLITPLLMIAVGIWLLGMGNAF